MAFKYNVNLIRDQIDRRRRSDNIFRLFTFMLLLFVVLLFATMIIYQARQYPLTVMARETQYISQLIERKGISPERVEKVMEENGKFESRLTGLNSAMQSSVPWVETLNTITAISMENGLILEKVESSVRGGRIVVNIEGVSYLEQPVNRIHEFALMMEETEYFDVGRMNSITSGDIEDTDGERVEVMRFRYETPFQHPLGTPVESANEQGGA